MAARKQTTTRKATRTATRRSTRRATAAPVEVTRSTSLMDYFRLGESYTSLVLGIIVVIIASILLVSLFKTRTASPVDSQKGTSSTSTSIMAEQEATIVPLSDVPSLQPTKTQEVDQVVTVTAAPTSRPQTPSPTATPLPTQVAESVSPTSISGQRAYTVKSGDNLWKIAVEQYNDGYKWPLIANVNNLTNPNIINVGNNLVLPSVSTPAKSVAQAQPSITSTPAASPSLQGAPQTGRASITGSTYTTAHGDDLWDIAVRAYGDGYRWVDIARANNFSNPGLIHAGNQIIIPR